MYDLNFIIAVGLFNVCCRSEEKMVQNNGDSTAKECWAVKKKKFP
jgi:hypothetical protein